MVYSTALSTTPSTSGVNVSTSVFDAKLDIMNIHTDFWIQWTFLTHSINIMSNSMIAPGPESCQLSPTVRLHMVVQQRL